MRFLGHASVPMHRMLFAHEAQRFHHHVSCDGLRLARPSASGNVRRNERQRAQPELCRGQLRLRVVEPGAAVAVADVFDFLKARFEGTNGPVPFTGSR